MNRHVCMSVLRGKTLRFEGVMGGHMKGVQEKVMIKEMTWRERERDLLYMMKFPYVRALAPFPAS